MQVPILTSESRSPGQFQWTFTVPADLPFFRGHFPGHPILPGVVALGWLLAAAESLQGRSSATLELLNVKFQTVIVPGAALELTLAAKSGGHLIGTIRSSAGVHATALIPRPKE